MTAALGGDEGDAAATHGEGDAEGEDDAHQHEQTEAVIDARVKLERGGKSERQADADDEQSPFEHGTAHQDHQREEHGHARGHGAGVVAETSGLQSADQAVHESEEERHVEKGQC